MADRINDADCNLVVTSDGLVRGAKKMLLNDDLKIIFKKQIMFFFRFFNIYITL